jgi:N-acetylglucosamine-6-sulfatase
VAQRDDGSVAQLTGQGAGFVPADRHRGRYAQAAVPRRPNATAPVRRKPALQRAIAGLPPVSPATGTPDQDVRDRLEMLLGVDESVQRIRDALAEMGELDNTVLIVTSDHGYFYGEHGLNEERRLAYEETARIPLVIRFPRVARAGSTPQQLVQVIDLAPTILDLAGVADTVLRQGASLVPLLTGSATPWRRSVLLEYYSDRVFPRMLNMAYQAVRTEQHKYIDYLELPGMDELYDLEADPFELENLIGTPAGDRLLPVLQAELTRLQQESGYRADFAGYR